MSEYAFYVLVPLTIIALLGSFGSYKACNTPQALMLGGFTVGMLAAMVDIKAASDIRGAEPKPLVGQFDFDGATPALAAPGNKGFGGLPLWLYDGFYIAALGLVALAVVAFVIGKIRDNPAMAPVEQRMMIKKGPRDLPKASVLRESNRPDTTGITNADRGWDYEFNIANPL